MQESSLSFSPFRGAVLLPFLHWHCPYTEQRHSPSKKKKRMNNKEMNKHTDKEIMEKRILSLWMRENVEWILNNWLGRNLEEKLNLCGGLSRSWDYSETFQNLTADLRKKKKGRARRKEGRKEEMDRKGRRKWNAWERRKENEKPWDWAIENEQMVP